MIFIESAANRDTIRTSKILSGPANQGILSGESNRADGAAQFESYTSELIRATEPAELSVVLFGARIFLLTAEFSTLGVAPALAWLVRGSATSKTRVATRADHSRRGECRATPAMDTAMIATKTNCKVRVFTLKVLAR